MALSIYLCTKDQMIIWILGQICLALSVLQSFFLLQKFGHGEEIESYKLNSLGGHITSFFCLVPYNQWRFLNSRKIKDAPRAIDIEKKFFPPLNVLAYSVKNYWNIKKLFGLFPEKSTRIKFLMSIFVMNFFFLVVMPNVPQFWKKFGIGYLLFLILVERWLVKQKAALTPDRGPEL